MRQRRSNNALRVYVAERMKNPRFRKAWERVQEENRLTRELVRLRVEQGLTQAQGAEMVETQQAAISRLEHRPPKHPTQLLRKVAAVYGYKVEASIELVPKECR